MRSIVLICGTALIVAGCGEVKFSDARRPLPLSEEYIVYQRDSRTGVCIASTSSVTYGGSHVRSISVLECTPEVLKQIQNDKQAEENAAAR